MRARLQSGRLAEVVSRWWRKKEGEYPAAQKDRIPAEKARSIGLFEAISKCEIDNQRILSHDFER